MILYEKVATNTDALQDSEVSEETTETTEETTEATTEETEIEYITTEGQSVDTNLYLSVPVRNASVNDIYSITLSLRNIVLVFALIFLLIKFKNMLHSACTKTFKYYK